MVQTIPKLNTFLYCQFGPFFEICIGPNLIWEVFGITVMSSGLIIITGSNETPKSGPVFIVKVVDSGVNEANIFF